ncbi:hypothetical protein U1Q18_020672 [Sarracenia purpurea var. burkii]
MGAKDGEGGAESGSLRERIRGVATEIESAIVQGQWCSARSESPKRSSRKKQIDHERRTGRAKSNHNDQKSGREPERIREDDHGGRRTRGPRNRVERTKCQRRQLETRTRDAMGGIANHEDYGNQRRRPWRSPNQRVTASRRWRRLEPG